MSTCKKRAIGGKTVGWEVKVNHTEAHKLNGLTINTYIPCAGVKAKAILRTVPPSRWKSVCALGQHDGVRAWISFYPPAVVLLPR